MAKVLSYLALATGYYGGAIIEAGEIFPADFREAVRDETKQPVQPGKRSKDGEWLIKPIYPIKRDANGDAVRGAVRVPSWVEPYGDGHDLAEVQKVDEYVAPNPSIDATIDALKNASAEDLKTSEQKASDAAGGGGEDKHFTDGMTREKLLAYAKEKDLDVKANDDKATLIAAIKSA